MSTKNLNHRSIGVRIARAALAALAVSALAATPHASAQMRQTEVQRRPAAQEARASADAQGGVVNIQTASLDELQRLPGIGPSKAAAIVAQRERTPFRRVEDILRVRGIGRATFRRLRPMITVSGPTTLIEEVRSSRRSAAPESEADDSEIEAAD